MENFRNQRPWRHNCRLLNNYWMRLSMISWIIKTEVCVICRSRRLGQITQTRGFDNSWYHAKTEFNNCFIWLYIFHVIHPQKQKRSVQPFWFWGEHSKGLSNQANIELDIINAISAADIAFIMLSSTSAWCLASSKRCFRLSEVLLKLCSRREGVTWLFSDIDLWPTHHYQCDVT